MTERRRIWFARPALFGVALASFALPFGTASCDDERATATGIQMIVRDAPATTVEGRAETRDDRDLGRQLVANGQPFAIASFALAAAGLAGGLVARRRGRRSVRRDVVTALLGLLVLLVGRIWASMQFGDFSSGPGLWLCSACFALVLLEAAASMPAPEAPGEPAGRSTPARRQPGRRTARA